MEKNQIEKYLIAYIAKTYKIDIKNEHVNGIFLHMNRLVISVDDNEENIARLESCFGVKASYIELTNHRLFNLKYEVNEPNIEKAVLLHAKDNLNEFLKKANKLPNGTKESVLNHIEMINGALDIALVLIK